MAVATDRATTVERWSPARIYLVSSGIFLLVIAAIGYALDQSFPTSPDAVGQSRWVFGLFETNGWHTTAGLISGFVALGFALRPEWAWAGAMAKGLFYVGVTTSLFLVAPSTFLLISNNADQVVHASLAVGGIGSALLTKRR